MAVHCSLFCGLVQYHNKITWVDDYIIKKAAYSCTRNYFLLRYSVFIPYANSSRVRNESKVVMRDLHFGTICHKV